MQTDSSTNTDSFSPNVRRLLGLLNPCTLCPRRCNVNRQAGEIGYCGAGPDALVSSAGPHFGEESVLVGAGGSGTVFFAGCNLRCVFCQNYDISHTAAGRAVSPDQLASMILALQSTGCVNINLVSPTHVASYAAAAIEIARRRGLTLPIVYNTGGYDSVETLRLLEGLVDIYMPDCKYADPAISNRLSDAADYPRVNRAAVIEMHRQVGDLQVEDGIARRGLLVRHLVLPENLACSTDILDFLAEEVSPNTAVNVMSQYHPCCHAARFPQINRRPTAAEHRAARQYALEKGLRVLD